MKHSPIVSLPEIDAFLKLHYYPKGIDYCAEHLDKPRAYIRGRASKLKLKISPELYAATNRTAHPKKLKGSCTYNVHEMPYLEKLALFLPWNKNAL